MVAFLCLDEIVLLWFFLTCPRFGVSRIQVYLFITQPVIINPMFLIRIRILMGGIYIRRIWSESRAPAVALVEKLRVQFMWGFPGPTPDEKMAQTTGCITPVKGRNYHQSIEFHRNPWPIATLVCLYMFVVFFVSLCHAIHGKREAWIQFTRFYLLVFVFSCGVNLNI